MPFNSLSYLVFLPVVYVIYAFTSDRFRWVVLLLGSFVFYSFLLQPDLLVVLAAVILFTHRFGRVLHGARKKTTRQKLLALGILVNLSPLIYYKYLSFIVSNIDQLLRAMTIDVSLGIPKPLVAAGLSFIIFHTISYLIDIYFHKIEPEPDLGIFALYVSYFPKLLQGPVERAGFLIPQLKVPFVFDYGMFRSGMLLFAWGLFKKTVMADRLAFFVNPVYNNVQGYNGFPLVLATYAFAFQLYYDFSGYTDMARGTARFFGVRLSENFNSPYLATSVSEFWRRWHMSFSRWILDYLFQPLQMMFRNLGKTGTVLALLCTFVTAGIWHEASWCFVIFGFLHGSFLSASVYYRPYQKRLHQWLGLKKKSVLNWWQVFVTFNLVCLSLIFFRANSVDDAMYIVRHLFAFRPNFTSARVDLGDFIARQMLMGNSLYGVSMIVLLFAVFIVVRKKRGMTIEDQPIWSRWLIYYSIVLSIVLFNVPEEQFIYFKF